MLTKPATERNCSAFKAYADQRRSARRRGVPFLLEFHIWQWLWLASGKWNQRGNRRGDYVMARNGDAGPYAVGNVFFQTVADNARQGNQGKSRKTAWTFCKVTRKRVYANDWRHQRNCASCATR